MPSRSASLAASSATPLFDTLDGAARDELLAIAQPVSFIPGAVLLRQGAPTRGAFFLRLGAAEASVQLPGGEVLIIAEAGAGGVIGEMALLEHSLCSSTVTARSAIDGLFIGRDDFRVLVARRSRAALTIQRAVTLNLCAKLTALNAQILAHPGPEDASWSTEPHAALSHPFAHAQACSFDYRRFLTVLPMFQGWEADEIDEIADLASVIELPRGSSLFQEGDEADALYITVRGAVEIAAPVTATVDRASPSTTAKTEPAPATASAASPAPPTHLRRLAVLGPGHLIGHRSLVDGSRHAARARTCEHSVLLMLTRAQFLDLYQGATPAALRLQAAVHGALLRAMAHTNVTLTRLVNLARLAAANTAALEAALAEQVLYAS